VSMTKCAKKDNMKKKVTCEKQGKVFQGGWPDEEVQAGRKNQGEKNRGEIKERDFKENIEIERRTGQKSLGVNRRGEKPRPNGGGLREKNHFQSVGAIENQQKKMMRKEPKPESGDEKEHEKSTPHRGWPQLSCEKYFKRKDPRPWGEKESRGEEENRGSSNS